MEIIVECKEENKNFRQILCNRYREYATWEGSNAIDIKYHYPILIDNT